jgi:hypothetical protein
VVQRKKSPDSVVQGSKSETRQDRNSYDELEFLISCVTGLVLVTMSFTGDVLRSDASEINGSEKAKGWRVENHTPIIDKVLNSGSRAWQVGAYVFKCNEDDTLSGPWCGLKPWPPWSAQSQL